VLYDVNFPMLSIAGILLEITKLAKSGNRFPSGNSAVIPGLR